MAELDDAIKRLNQVTASQARVSKKTVTAVAQIRARADAIEADVVAVAVVANNTAARVDTHTQQIQTHDNWFVSVFERLGKRPDWTVAYLAGIIAAGVSFVCLYAFVFNQYTQDRHFADAAKGIDIVIPGYPVLVLIVSIACAAVIGAFVALVISHLKAHNEPNPEPTDEAEPEAEATEETGEEPAEETPTAPVAPPVGDVVLAPPPPPVPAPAEPVPVA